MTAGLVALTAMLVAGCSSAGSSSASGSPSPSPSTTSTPTSAKPGTTLVAANLQPSDLPRPPAWLRRPGITGPSRSRQAITCLGSDPAKHLVAEVNSPLFVRSSQTAGGATVEISSSVALLDSDTAALGEQSLLTSPKAPKCVASVFLDTVRSSIGSAADSAKLTMRQAAHPAGGPGSADYSGALMAPDPQGTLHTVAHLRVVFATSGRCLVTLVGIGVGPTTTFPAALFDRLTARLDGRASSLG